MTILQADKLKPLVWLTEDQDDYAKTATDYLQANGFRVRRFRSNHEASKEIDAAISSPGLVEKPEAILVDYYTGDGFNGVRLVEATKNSSWRSVPMIALSSDPDYNREMIEMGATAGFQKGYMINSLTGYPTVYDREGLSYSEQLLQKIQDLIAQSKQR